MNSRHGSRREFLNALAACAAALAMPVGAQQASGAYPIRPIRLIIPFATAGAADLVARTVAERLSQRLGQQVVPDNKPGASGNIGTQMVATAEPDGYTLVLGFDGTLVINPYLFGKSPFNVITDFEPIGLIGDVPLLIVARPDLPARNLRDLIALSKTRPNGLEYGTAGTGSTQHLMMELIKQRTGANFVHIPYKGAAPAMTDVLGGHLPLAGAALAGSLEYIKAGKLRAFTISSAKRSKYLPEVPTLIESGMDDFVITAWHCLLAPVKTPRPIVERLNRELNAVLAEPDTVERLAVLGSIAEPGTPEQLTEHIKRDLARYAEIVKVAGIRIEQ